MSALIHFTFITVSSTVVGYYKKTTILYLKTDIILLPFPSISYIIVTVKSNLIPIKQYVW
jgi:hypothetical protein